ncbi:hypothetical protein FOL47_003186 [Perkinsus chesapeaki]|uniref:Uncharacterized protein n=1 Tax=Perkinsus chesapeaki TaxID=330153 RepID=A0A7J6M940_PERCH|nr:hypothetical protein FOL47_003186 [Perkinsus chesapeaki]
MPSNKKSAETTEPIDVEKWMVDELGSLGLDGIGGAKLIETLLDQASHCCLTEIAYCGFQHPRKADRVTQVRKYLTTAGFKRASANSISRTIVAVVEGSLPPTSLKDKVDTSSDKEAPQRHQQQATPSEDLEFWSPSEEESAAGGGGMHQGLAADTPSPPRATKASVRPKKAKPIKITGRDLTTMLGVTQERSIQKYSDDEGHGGRVLTRPRKPLTTASKDRSSGSRNVGMGFASAVSGQAHRPVGVWADPTRTDDRSRSLSPELSEVYGTALRKGQVKLSGMQLLQVFDNARAQSKLKRDMAGRRLRTKADDGQSSDDDVYPPPATSSPAEAFWQTPDEDVSGKSAPEPRAAREKPRRLRGNKAHERPQDFEEFDKQQKETEAKDLFATLPAVPINDEDETENVGGVYHATSRKDKKKNAKKQAVVSSKKGGVSKPASPPPPAVVAPTDSMMLQLLAKHQVAQREEAERKKKAEEEEKRRIAEEEEEIRRQQEEEKARLEREEQWRKQREEAQRRQIELKKREEEEERKRQLEAAQRAEEERRRKAIEEAVRKEKEEMMRQKEAEEKERKEKEEALQKQREEELRRLKEAQESQFLRSRNVDTGGRERGSYDGMSSIIARQSQLEAERLRKQNEEKEAQAAMEAKESGKEQQEIERKAAALAAMQAAMEAREKEFEERMKAMQEKLQQLEANKGENGESSNRSAQQLPQQQQIIDRQLSVITASRSATARQQCVNTMKHFLQRLTRQYDIHVDTGSWKKRLEQEGEGAAPTWNWCDQLLVFRPLDSRGSKVLPTPMPAYMDTDNCEVRITHVVLCTNYVGLIIGDVKVDGQEERERLAAGVIVCGRSGGLPGQSPVGTYRAIDVVRAVLRRNKDTLDSDWTVQGVKEIKDLDVTPQSSLTNQDHKHEDVYLQELEKPMFITAPRETITVKQRAPPARSGSQTTGALPPWRRNTATEELPWAAGPSRQQSNREPGTPNALFRTGERRDYTDSQIHFDQEGRSYGLLEMLRFRTISAEPPKELMTMREIEGFADSRKKDDFTARSAAAGGEQATAASSRVRRDGLEYRVRRKIGSIFADETGVPASPGSALAISSRPD